MTINELIGVFSAFAVAIGAVSVLVVQTARLVSIAESYMVELRANNRQVASSTATIAEAASAVAGTTKAAPGAPGRPRYLRRSA